MNFHPVGTAYVPGAGMPWSMICFGSALQRPPSSATAIFKLQRKNCRPVRISGNSSSLKPNQQPNPQ